MASNDQTFVVDEFYFSALFDADEIYPISDEKYALELQLQEALISSAASETLQINKRVKTEHHHDHTNYKGKQKLIGESSKQQNTIVSSNSPSFCTICMDTKPITEMFISTSSKCCDHSFCKDCISKYVASKIQENISSVRCPDLNCQGMLEPQDCRSIVPRQVFDRWENALCESLILGAHKFYCPYKDCSAMMVDDGGEHYVVTESECPNCHRLFCAQCNVPWHVGYKCDQFQKLDKNERSIEDLLMMELAKGKEWKRCSSCRMFVEKTEGCIHISCRCGNQFCYKCGLQWSNNHACCY